MQKDKAVYIQIIGYLLFIIITISFIPDASRNLWQGLEDCSVYEGDWQVETTTQKEEFDTLPTFFYTENDEQDIWISKKLENVSDGDCIGFFSFQQQVSIMLDGKTIYEFVPTDYANSSTPGNKWNFLPVNEEDNGKTVTIHIFQCYSKSRVTIPTIYYGTQAGIVMNYVSLELPRTCLSLAIILFGILIGIFCILSRKKTDITSNLQWLALFALFRGIWGTIEGNLYSLFISRLLVVSQISYLSLKLAVVTYLRFINVTLHKDENRVLKILTMGAVLDFWITMALQIFGICDYANTVFVTHGIMLISAVYVCICIGREIRNQRKNALASLSAKRKNLYYAQLFCTLIVIATSIVDMVRYYTTNSPDVARFTRIGDIIYVITMALALFLDFVYLISSGYACFDSSRDSNLRDTMKRADEQMYKRKLELKGEAR